MRGAAPPLIIHEKKNSKERDLNTQHVGMNEDRLASTAGIPVSYLLGFDDEAKDSSDDNARRNPCGFNVRLSLKKGSMTKDLFPEYCEHFITSIQEQSHLMRLGKGMRPVFLFLDGHGSRWIYKSLERLMDENIWCIFLPSKTSILSQLNDNGVNLVLHRKLNDAATVVQKSIDREAGEVASYNAIIKRGWEDFLSCEESSVVNFGRNSTTSAFQKTGLHPYNPSCIGWESAIRAMEQGRDEPQIR